MGEGPFFWNFLKPPLELHVLVTVIYLIEERLRKIKWAFTAAKATCANILRDLLHNLDIKLHLPAETVSFQLCVEFVGAKQCWVMLGAPFRLKQN